MCNIIPSTGKEITGYISPGHEYKVNKHGVKAHLTRTLDGHVLLCKHGDESWELTPELKPNEVLDIPEDAMIKLVTMIEWNEIYAREVTPQT